MPNIVLFNMIIQIAAITDEQIKELELKTRAQQSPNTGMNPV